MPTLAAELKKNISDTAYVLQGTLERLGMHSVPQFGLTPEARIARSLLETGVEALSARKQENYAQAAVRAVIKEMRTPLLSKEVRLGLINLPIKVTAEELVCSVGHALVSIVGGSKQLGWPGAGSKYSGRYGFSLLCFSRRYIGCVLRGASMVKQRKW